MGSQYDKTWAPDSARSTAHPNEWEHPEWPPVVPAAWSVVVRMAESLTDAQASRLAAGYRRNRLAPYYVVHAEHMVHPTAGAACDAAAAAVLAAVEPAAPTQYCVSVTAHRAVLAPGSHHPAAAADLFAVDGA